MQNTEPAPTASHDPVAHPLLHLSHPDHHLPGYELPETASKPLSKAACVAGCVIAFVIAGIGWLLHHFAGEPPSPEVAIGWAAPFVLLLACIAIMPFAAKHFWEKNYQFVSAGLALFVMIYYLFGIKDGAKVMSATIADYISFIFLLGSLFVVSGGILIRTRRKATPFANTGVLLIGAILANVFGTTGASMLLIRPFLRMNKGHVRPYHVVFFIFCVANVGGALTPIGDPPLFLGYLRGVPFFWVLQHAWPIWATAIALLLVIFFVIDFLNSKKQERLLHGDAGLGPPVSIFGASNIIFIAMILAAVFLDAPWREGLMALAAFLSLATTPRRVHGENHFNYAPIKEVALLFIGIFATMVPAMNFLHNNAAKPAFERLLNTPGQFYFGSGALSSVLDNAPTYVTFLETALGKFNQDTTLLGRERVLLDKKLIDVQENDVAGLSKEQGDRLRALHTTLRLAEPRDFAAGNLNDEQLEMGLVLDDSGHLNNNGNPYFKYLLAISMGSVFFGACTYIGNGPNFMVKSIADHAGAPTPSFFGYIVSFTLPVLLPILILCWALYLR